MSNTMKAFIFVVFFFMAVFGAIIMASAQSEEDATAYNLEEFGVVDIENVSTGEITETEFVLYIPCARMLFNEIQSELFKVEYIVDTWYIKQEDNYLKIIIYRKYTQ